MKLLFSILFCISFVFCHAQNDFELKLDSILAIEDSSVKIQSLENLKGLYNEKSTKLFAKLYHKLGVEYYKKEGYLKAIQNVQEALSIKKSIVNTSAFDIHQSLNMLSLCYRNVENIEEYLKTLLLLANSVEHTKYKTIALLNLAILYNDIGDYFESIKYSDRIIDSYSVHNNEDKLIGAYIEKLRTYAEMSSNDPIFLTDIENNEKELEKRKEYLYPEDKISYYNSLGIIYRAYHKREKALNFYQKAFDNITDETSLSEGNGIYLNIAEMHSQLKEVEKAKEFYNKVIETKDSVTVSAVYNNLGYYHATSTEQEIEYHLKAIQLLGIKSDLSKNSSFIEELKSFSEKRDLLSSLIDLSQAWIKLYNQNKKEKHIHEALKVLYAIDDLISIMRLESEAKSSKLFWIKRGVNSYVEAVKACYLLNKPEEAFYFMEKNKSLYLLEQLEQIQRKSQYKIPNQLLEREATLEYKVIEAKTRLKKDPKKKSLQDLYTQVFQEHMLVLDSLKRVFPEYYESNLKPELISLSEFQDFLKEKNTQAVDYILGEKEGYGLWIDEDSIEFFKLEEYSKLQDDIAFIKSKMKPSLTKEEVLEYQKTSRNVFTRLFPKNRNLAKLNGNKLAIIPDGALYNFNFEVLIVDQKPALKDNFLINIAEISYLNSASVAKNLYTKEEVNSHSYLGIAPINFNSNKLVDLKSSETIMKETTSLFSSELKLKETATKEAFLKASSESLILHINTHAGVDEKTKHPWLSMYDTLVSLEEVYVKSRSHNLVFLDACKTGDGKLQKGEGIESLSRAFFNSGSKSVIASQWNANEKVTNAISLSFFKELKKGSTKSSALRNAKLTYLKNSELSNSLPYFWASLTLTGNSDALPKVSNNLYHWIIIVAILFLVFILYNKRRRRTSKV